jgi:uncharacterized membrane protein
MWVAVFAFFATFGACYACVVDTKTEYGSEELYISGDSLKSAPYTRRTGGDGFIFLLPFIVAGVGVISMIGCSVIDNKIANRIKNGGRRERGSGKK